MKSAKPAESQPETRRGRPRAFDADAALDAAMRVFWQHGYEGTSLPDLEAAMGINRPSLYAAFGNKESLFRKAVDRYVAGATRVMNDALAAPTARAAIERVLKMGVGGCESTATRGCMLVQGALACGEASESIRRELIARRGSVEIVIRERLAKGIRDGDLPPDTDADALAKYVVTVQQGMAVQAAGNATREQLLATVELAMRAIPSA